MAILQDPVMQSILQQAKADPKVSYPSLSTRFELFADLSPGVVRPHEEPRRPGEDPEAHGCGCHQDGPVSLCGKKALLYDAATIFRLLRRQDGGWRGLWRLFYA